MSDFRYQLEKYTGMKSRYHCPNCRRKEFTRYIDTYSNIHVDPKVGRCNREEKCAYHFTPKAFFKNNIVPSFSKTAISKIQTKKLPTFHFDQNVMDTSLGEKVKSSSLYLFLRKQFNGAQVDRTIEKYKVGTSNYWNGSSVFWQIDINQKIRAGKIMDYNPCNGKRHKNRFLWYEKPLGYQMNQCLFGEHLLKETPLKLPIGIVESEKTALICDIVFGREFLWLSTGGIHGLKTEKFQGLDNRSVYLFPDLSPSNATLSAFEIWKKKADVIGKSMNTEIKISTYLEKIATDLEREQQWDLADYICQKSEFISH